MILFEETFLRFLVKNFHFSLLAVFLANHVSDFVLRETRVCGFPSSTAKILHSRPRRLGRGRPTNPRFYASRGSHEFFRLETEMQLHELKISSPSEEEKSKTEQQKF